MPSRPFIVLVLMLAACGPPDPEGPPEPPAGTNGNPSATNGTCEDGPGELFESRIKPLLENDRPSSCSKCHAAGVNLAAFVTGDACSSMACLVELEMVNLRSPYDSKLLEFIDRGYEPDPETGVTDVMVANEYNGFLEWIRWSAACPDACPEPQGSLECGSPETPLREDDGEPERPPLPPLDTTSYPCTEDAQAQAFADYVFPPQSRCGHCHAVNGAIAGIADAPTWIAHKPTLTGAKRTIQNLYALGAINLETPAKSRLLLKPLHPDAGGIKHGGGSKFLDTTDPLYVDMLTWIRMQKECGITRNVTPKPELFDDKYRNRMGEIPYVR